MPIRYAISALRERSDHPLLLGLFITSVVLVIVGYAVAQTVGSEITAGFLTVYATIAAFMGLMGYLLLTVSKIYRKWLVSYT